LINSKYIIRILLGIFSFVVLYILNIFIISFFSFLFHITGYEDIIEEFNLLFFFKLSFKYWYWLILLFLFEFLILTVFFVKIKFPQFWFFSTDNLYLKDTRFNEYGSARWLEKKEINQIFPTLDKIDHGFVVQTILNKKQNKMEFNVRPDAHNLVIGATGSGKTQKIIIPSLLVNAQSKTKPTLIVTDPKGELYNSHSLFFKNQGYDVYNLNLRDFSNSNSWNPLTKILEFYKVLSLNKKAGIINNQTLQYESLIFSWINDIVESIFAENDDSKNKFWTEAAMNTVKSIIFYMLEKHDDNQDIDYFYYNLTNCALIAGNWETYLQKLNSKPLDSFSRIIGFATLKGAQETTGSIMQIVNNGLRIFSDPLIKGISCINDFSLEDLILKPSVVFLIVPDETQERNAFVSMFISQFYKNTIRLISDKKNLKLDRPLYFLFDEFANIPKISNMSQIITVSRSRNIFFLLIIQGLQQLNDKYGKEVAETIFNNCTLHTFLQTMDLETAKRYSEIIGDKTVLTYSFSNSGVKGSSNNSSRNLQAKKLIEASELMKLEKNTAIILLNKENPAKTYLLPYHEWKVNPEGVYINLEKTNSLSSNFYFNFLEDQKTKKKIVKTKKSEDINPLDFIKQEIKNLEKNIEKNKKKKEEK
jgi:type IV secretion system protein VirD4